MDLKIDKKTGKTTNIVSIRLPPVMLSNLKKKMKEEFYIDMSEAIRDIIRNKYLEATNSDARIDRIKKDLIEGIRTKVEDDVSKKVIEELEKIKYMIEGGKN